MPDCRIVELSAAQEQQIHDAKGYSKLVLNADGSIGIVADQPMPQPIRNAVVQQAQSAVSTQLNALTPQQQRALIACLLYKVGAIDASLTVLPLGQWL